MTTLDSLQLDPDLLVEVLVNKGLQAVLVQCNLAHLDQLGILLDGLVVPVMMVNMRAVTILLFLASLV